MLCCEGDLFEHLSIFSTPPLSLIILSREKYVNSQIINMITLSLKKKSVTKFASIEKLVSLQARN